MLLTRHSKDLSHKGFLGSKLYPKNTARTRAFAIMFLSHLGKSIYLQDADRHVDTRAPHWMLLSGCILEPEAWLSLSPQPSAMTVSGL